jgi:AcrR family transcriptional regulator
MGIKGENNRQLIVEAADNLFYRRGYNQTSFQDISDATGIPRGNFYYYFKTKEDILNAVVDARVDNMMSMLTQLDGETESARERLLKFSNILDYNSEDVLRSGCPLGTLSSELAKDEPALQEKSRKVFVVLCDWLNKQFNAAGASNPEELAMDLLAKMQGITVMACAFKDKDYITRSHQAVKDWVDNQVKH